MSKSESDLFFTTERQAEQPTHHRAQYLLQEQLKQVAFYETDITLCYIK